MIQNMLIKQIIIKVIPKDCVLTKLMIEIVEHRRGFTRQVIHTAQKISIKIASKLHPSIIDFAQINVIGYDCGTS